MTSQENTRNKLQKIFLGLNIILLLLLILFIIINIYLNRLYKYDGIRINLLGRQRALSQQLTKELLLYQLGKLPSDKIFQTIGIFDTSLRALTYGGKIQIKLNKQRFRVIPQMDQQNIREKLYYVIANWKKFKHHLHHVINNNYATSLEYVITHNDTLVLEIDNVVSMLQKSYEYHNTYKQVSILSMLIIMIVLISFNMWRLSHEVRSTKKQINELDNFLPICSNCKKIRKSLANPYKQESWMTIENFLLKNEEIQVTHGMCPECLKKMYGDIDNE